MKKSVFITGAAGFIGRHTVEKFVAEGWYVYALVHHVKSETLQRLQNEGLIEIIHGDITSYESMKTALSQCEITPDVIVHCAGRASDVGWKKEFRKINYESTQHIVKLVKEQGVKKFVFISTTDVYGLKDFHGETEDELKFEINSRNSYPKFKIQSEQCIKQELSPERFSIIRPAVVWGEDDTTITKRMVDFLKISPFIIHFGKWRGKNIWSLANVKTVANAIYLASTMREAEGQGINVLDDNQTTIDEFYQRIADEYFPDKKFKRIYLPIWLGIIFGGIITFISNILNLKQPFTDPSLYALYSISSNLDFSNKKLSHLVAIYKKHPKGHLRDSGG